MNEELKNKVKNYGNEIEQITDWVKKARQTKDVYIGRVAGNLAFLTMAREIIQNAIDEILKGNSVLPNFKVSYDEKSHMVSVEDFGRGIPHGMIGTIFGTDHTSSNYNKVAGSGNYSAGKNGCGASITCALTKWFGVDSYVLGKGVHAEFMDGYLWDKGEVVIPKTKSTKEQGSIISFIPDEIEIGKVTTKCDELYGLIYIMMPATPIGTSVEFVGIKSDGKQYVRQFTNQYGIVTHLNDMLPNPYINPIGAFADNGTMRVDLAFSYDTQSGGEENLEKVISLNNTCPTNGGSHVDGAMDGICKWFKNYMNKIYLANSKSKTKLVCTNTDVKAGLRIAISTFHLFASYNGQAKEVLDNADMVPFVSQTVMTALDEWAKKNPSDLEKVCKWYKQVIELRLKMDKEKVKLSSSFTSSLFTGYPSKYIKPNSNGKNNELIIVEGDSAFSSCRNARDPNTQGIFPIRGKLPNAFIHPPAKMLANEEIASIISICGGGYGKKFNLAKCRIARLIIMTDADPDGAHIRNLILAFVAVYMRPLLDNNMVYSGTPPLYGLRLNNKSKKGPQYRYFRDDEEVIDFVRKEFMKTYTIYDMNGKAYTPKQTLDILVRNKGYVDAVDRVSKMYAIDPFLVEDIVMNIGQPFAKFKKLLNSKYPFAEVSQNKEFNAIVINGVVNRLVHFVIINDLLLSQCGEIKNYLSMSPYMYRMNDTPVTLYTLISEFNKFMPPALSRFKGLGEMTERMLKESALDPENRVLYRYTFEDVEREIQEMRRMNDNKQILVKGIDEYDK